MGIETIYTCDRCKQRAKPIECIQVMVVTSPPNKPTPLACGVIQRSQMWCRSCIVRNGIVEQPYIGQKPEPPELLTIEDLLRQMVTEIVQEIS